MQTLYTIAEWYFYLACIGVVVIGYDFTRHTDHYMDSE